MEIIYNNTTELDLSICKHGMQTCCCNICNGKRDEDYEKQRLRDREKQITTRETMALIKSYEKVKYAFKDRDDLWTREEVETVWDSLECISRNKFKKEVYLLTLTLNRTYGAVMWEFRHLFIDKPYHRSKVTIDFLAEKGIFYNSKSEQNNI